MTILIPSAQLLCDYLGKNTLILLFGLMEVGA